MPKHWGADEICTLLIALMCVVGIGGYVLIYIIGDPENQEKRIIKERRKYRKQFDEDY